MRATRTSSERSSIFSTIRAPMSRAQPALQTPARRRLPAAEIELLIQSPSDLAGAVAARSATFNPPSPWDVTGTVELADDGIGLGNDACDPLVEFTSGNIALITMAACCGAISHTCDQCRGGGGHRGHRRQPPQRQPHHHDRHRRTLHSCRLYRQVGRQDDPRRPRSWCCRQP